VIQITLWLAEPQGDNGGSVIQEISFENPGNSTFNILDLSQSKGVSFKTTVAANTINAFHMVDSKENDISVSAAQISLTSDMKIQKNLVLSNCKLDTAGKDIDIKGSLTLSGGTLSLNGSDFIVQGDMNFQGGTANLSGGHLSVMGNLKQTSGTMDINEGVLTVAGDYAVSNANSYCYAYLKMVKDSDRVSVGGSFTMQSYYSHSGD
jgi:phage baseplate assembly protein gpV